MGTQNFSLSHARDKMKTSFFKTEDCSLSFAQSPIQSLNNNPDPGSQRTEIK